MSYSLHEATTFEGVIEYTTGVIAGLKTDDALAPHAVEWETMRQTARAARDARDDDRYARIEASAVVRVRDYRWDRSVVDLSGRAFLASDKKAKQPPYSVLFGKVKADQATNLGPAKATVYGKNLVAKSRELAHPELGASTDAVEEANGQLAAAHDQRAEAVEALSIHDIRRLKLVRDVEELIAATELKILTEYVGEGEYVRAILSPHGSAKS